ncbi:MAG: hypothetical protein KA327_11255 [Pseudarcicella sp.]|nr:hypothetical protein [Pseudarcicella sp.]
MKAIILSIATALFISSCATHEKEVSPVTTSSNTVSKLQVQDWSKGADGMLASPETTLNLSDQNTFFLSPTSDNIQKLKDGESFVVQVSKDNKTWADNVYTLSQVQIIQGINSTIVSETNPLEIVLDKNFKSKESMWIKVGTRKYKAPVANKNARYEPRYFTVMVGQH